MNRLCAQVGRAPTVAARSVGASLAPRPVASRGAATLRELEQNILEKMTGERRRTPFARVVPYANTRLQRFKPLTARLRMQRRPMQNFLYNGKAVRELTIAKRKTGGRSHTGRLTVRGIGGGARRRIRIVDYRRHEPGPQTVVRIERDPNRHAHLALLQNQHSGNLSYIVAPAGLRAGDTVQSYVSDILRHFGSKDDEHASGVDMGLLRTVGLRPGNCMALRYVPVGMTVHCIALQPRGRARLCRGAGTHATVVVSTDARGKYGQVRMPSGEIRKIPLDASVTIGRVGNQDHHFAFLGSAGARRWRGKRPKVRGVAMNRSDHPLGGGRGKSKSNQTPRDRFGNVEGVRTRRPKSKHGNRMVVVERPR